MRGGVSGWFRRTSLDSRRPLIAETMKLFVILFFSHLSCIGLGFLLYHRALKKRGIFGRLVAGKVENRLENALNLSEEEKPHIERDLHKRRREAQKQNFKQGD